MAAMLTKNGLIDMILEWEPLVEEFKLNIHGMIQIGSHIGQEYSVLKDHGCSNFLMFEPVPHTYDKLLKTIESVGSDNIDVITENFALGKEDGETVLYLDDREQASTTALRPVNHLTLYPNIKFDTTITVPLRSLDSYCTESDLDLSKFNMINIDVGGYELEVFRGATQALSAVDYIMTEVNRTEMYEGCCNVNELDKYLGEYGFSREKTGWPNAHWGDAFYVKS